MSKKNTYSIERLCRDCDVERWVAKRVVHHMGCDLKHECDACGYENIVKTIEHIRKINGGVIDAVRIDGYFKGGGKRYTLDDLSKELYTDIHTIALLRKELGIARKPIFHNEFVTLSKYEFWCTKLYGGCTKRTVRAIIELMLELNVKNIFELEDKIHNELGVPMEDWVIRDSLDIKDKTLRALKNSLGLKKKPVFNKDYIILKYYVNKCRRTYGVVGPKRVVETVERLKERRGKKHDTKKSNYKRVK